MSDEARLHIPQTFTFREKPWEVQMVKGMSRWDGDALGRCESFCNLISLDSTDQNRSQLEETYVHELLHAIWPTGVCGDRMEEKVIRALQAPLRELILSGALRRVDEA